MPIVRALVFWLYSSLVSLDSSLIALSSALSCSLLLSLALFCSPLDLFSLSLALFLSFFSLFSLFSRLFLFSFSSLFLSCSLSLSLFRSFFRFFSVYSVFILLLSRNQRASSRYYSHIFSFFPIFSSVLCLSDALWTTSNY